MALIFIGIVDENREDVKWCVSTSSLEKRIRYAARNMFHSINTAHKEVLSPEEYSAAIKNLTGGKEQKLLLAAGIVHVISRSWKVITKGCMYQFSILQTFLCVAALHPW